MIKKLFKRLFKKPKKAPLFKKGDAIRVMQLIEAKKVYTGLKCHLDKNMLLLFNGETENEFFFIVRTNFKAMFTKTEFAYDRDEVFINKEVLKASDFRKKRN